MRAITIEVTNQSVGSAIVWGYPRDDVGEDDLGPLYEVPVYKIIVRGTSDAGTQTKREFEAIRFGVQQKTTKDRPAVVGLANEQTHIVKKWLPNYSVHSADSEERGAWQVIGNFLIHDGPDNPLDKGDPFASIGCVEICGKKAFVAFNEYLASISGATEPSLMDKLAAMGDHGTVKVHYVGATRPPLQPAK